MTELTAVEDMSLEQTKTELHYQQRAFEIAYSEYNRAYNALVAVINDIGKVMKRQQIMAKDFRSKK